MTVLAKHLKLLISCLFLVPTLCFGWENHYLLTYVALRDFPIIKNAKPVAAETLTEFVTTEKNSLSSLLQDNENWSRIHIPLYPPLPGYLQFNADIAPGLLVKHFLESIRVNPTLTFPLYYLVPPGLAQPNPRTPLKRSDLMLPINVNIVAIRTPNERLEQLQAGALVAPLDIISAASDEPDYGLDMGLWSNNNTWYGDLYQWGEQPFGNINVANSSQAPFHMGFYHESSTLYFFAGYLKRCYPEYRIHTYLSLSKLAFKTGHAYWGYRFLGWAIHYVQDLTQPYHASSTPGFGTTRLIWVAVQNAIWITSPKQRVIAYVTNRHFSLENYLYNLLVHSIKLNLQKNPYIYALASNEIDHKYPRYDDDYPRQIVAKETHGRAENFNRLLSLAFDEKYVSDENYQFYHDDPTINLLITKSPDATARLELNDEIMNVLQSIGAHTRKTVASVLIDK